MAERMTLWNYWRGRRQLRRWRRYEAGLLADKGAWWARQAEMESDPSKHDERRNTALMFAAAARAMREAS